LLDPARYRVGVAVAAVLHIHAHTNNAAVVSRRAGRLYNPTLQVSTRRITMPVLIRHRAAMSAAQYDESAPALIEQLKKQPGFLVHVAYEDADGFVVAEVWETQEQHDTWFDASVKPNIPVEITQEVIDLHSVHTP
jgi:Antibiotic biosynthesis monooxygenase